MDWNYAIERNHVALKRVLLALVAMAALPILHAGGAADGARPTLPRHLHRAVLRLLRPAEAAARRLVIMAARGVAVTWPRQRPRRPKPPLGRATGGRPGTVTGIWLPPQLRPDGTSRAPRRAPAFPALPLFDPLRRLRGAGRKARGVPRLCLPGFSAPHPAPLKRTSKGLPDDAVDAARLRLRLLALAAALDDLPRAAKRFARWQARQAAGAAAQTRDASQAAGAPGPRRPGRACRVWPLKPGRPPGSSARAGHAVHEILRDTHHLAAQALEHPDTS